jgi:hypothetical protein
MPDSKVIKMKLAKTTKSTDVYQADGSEPECISTVYIFKWFTKQCPSITVTVTKD